MHFAKAALPTFSEIPIFENVGNLQDAENLAENQIERNKTQSLPNASPCGRTQKVFCKPRAKFERDEGRKNIFHRAADLRF